MRTPEPTLSAVLSALGWRHEPLYCERRGTLGKRRVYDDKGEHVGNFDAFECWRLLRERGLYADGADTIDRLKSARAIVRLPLSVPVNEPLTGPDPLALGEDHLEF